MESSRFCSLRTKLGITFPVSIKQDSSKVLSNFQTKICKQLEAFGCRPESAYRNCRLDVHTILFLKISKIAGFGTCTSWFLNWTPSNKAYQKLQLLNKAPVLVLRAWGILERNWIMKSLHVSQELDQKPEICSDVAGREVILDFRVED